jgi:hypothetical protein
MATLPPNKALKLTAHGSGEIGCGAPQLNAVLGGRFEAEQETGSLCRT